MGHFFCVFATYGVETCGNLLPVVCTADVSKGMNSKGDKAGRSVEVLCGKAEAARLASGRARRDIGSHLMVPKVHFLGMNICWKEKKAGAS